MQTHNILQKDGVNGAVRDPTSRAQGPPTCRDQQCVLVWNVVWTLSVWLEMGTAVSWSLGEQGLSAVTGWTLTKQAEWTGDFGGGYEFWSVSFLVTGHL